jgi:hypothetical protein
MNASGVPRPPASRAMIAPITAICMYSETKKKTPNEVQPYVFASMSA